MPRVTAGRAPRRRSPLGGRRPARLVVAALGLTAIVLAGLSLQAVRREALVRTQLVIETHRGVADLIQARLAPELARVDAAIATELGQATSGAALIDALASIEAGAPWLAPLVVLPRDRGGSNAEAGDRSASAGQAAFDAVLREAQRVELAQHRFAAAEALYAKAASDTAPGPRRLAALNGLGRSARTVGRQAAAASAYARIVTEGDPLDSAQARWIAVAVSQLLECDAALGDHPAYARHAVALYELAVTYRFTLGPETAAFYGVSHARRSGAPRSLRRSRRRRGSFRDASTPSPGSTPSSVHGPSPTGPCPCCASSTGREPPRPTRSRQAISRRSSNSYSPIAVPGPISAWRSSMPPAAPCGGLRRTSRRIWHRLGRRSIRSRSGPSRSTRVGSLSMPSSRAA
jgi:hypothetical protein